MALLAEKGAAGNQQVLIYRAVGFVAQATIFGYRRVFKQERAAFLTMAADAGGDR